MWPAHILREDFRQSSDSFDSVCVGLEYVLVPVDLSGSVRGSLQQEIIVTVHTGNQTSAQFGGIQRCS